MTEEEIVSASWESHSSPHLLPILIPPLVRTREDHLGDGKEKEEEGKKNRGEKRERKDTENLLDHLLKSRIQ